MSGPRQAASVLMWVNYKPQSLNLKRGHWSNHHRERNKAGEAWRQAVLDSGLHWSHFADGLSIPTTSPADSNHSGTP